MFKKRSFPHDWSNLTDQQVLESIDYLQKNYKKYPVFTLGDSQICIGKDIVLSFRIEHSLNGYCLAYTINNMTYINKPNSDIYNKLRQLHNTCRHEQMRRLHKRELLIVSLYAAMFLSLLGILAYTIAVTKDKTDNQSKVWNDDNAKDKIDSRILQLKNAFKQKTK